MAHELAVAREVLDFDAKHEILRGLWAPQKTLPSKLLYDEEGSRLFEAICELPEYYVTRSEVSLLKSVATAVSATIPGNAALVEFGSGASLKTRLLLDAAPQITLYVPIDISPTALNAAVDTLGGLYPNLQVAPMVDDYTRVLALPVGVKDHNVVGFFPGSTIGNFSPREAEAFLRRARALLGPNAAFIIGADIAKSAEVLIPAYNDAQGVTAAFNTNLLTRLNREFGANFALEAFRHRAVWNAGRGRMEMHLESLFAQTVSLAGGTIGFRAGETIHTENSYKFRPISLVRMAARAGWRLTSSWISEAPAVALFSFAS